MPGSSTPPGRQALRFRAWLCCLPPSKQRRRTGIIDFVAQWLAYALPYRRFVDVLANGNARLGADVVRYTFTVSDFHRLLLAGLPAHFESDMPSHAVGLPDVSGRTGVGRGSAPMHNKHLRY